jgi:hypothetical protein
MREDLVDGMCENCLDKECDKAVCTKDCSR